jgi:hypothetical protein
MSTGVVVFEHALKPVRAQVDQRVNKELDDMVKRIGEGTLTPQSAFKDLPALLGPEQAQLVQKTFAVTSAGKAPGLVPATPVSAAKLQTLAAPGTPKTPTGAIVVPTGGTPRPSPLTPGTAKPGKCHPFDTCQCLTGPN